MNAIPQSDTMPYTQYVIYDGVYITNTPPMQELGEELLEQALMLDEEA